MKNKEALEIHIEELKEILDMDEFSDLEEKMNFLTYLGDCEDWLKNNTDVNVMQCGLCGGSGKHQDYENEWGCHACYGIGLSFCKA